ncbi:hypothetical protein [Sinorhizobium medicae]
MARHASLAEQLQGVLAYKNRPDGPVEPVQTNWTTAAANDNNPEDLAGMRIERRWSIRPTPEEIDKEVKDGEVERGAASTMGLVVDGQAKTVDVPGPIVAIGKLRFSDGSQTERAHVMGIDGQVIMADVRMPIGALLGTRDRQERALGGDVITSNSAYTLVYRGKHPGKVKRKKREDLEDREITSREEDIAILAAAKANTASMPAVTKCPDGFPWKPSNLRELFLGLEKTPTGESGSVEWRDITSHLAERAVWAASIAAITQQDKAALDAALTASSLSEVGVAVGQSRQYADKRSGGRRALIAANDNLMAAIKKISA